MAPVRTVPMCTRHHRGLPAHSSTSVEGKIMDFFTFLGIIFAIILCIIFWRQVGFMFLAAIMLLMLLIGSCSAIVLLDAALSM